MSTPTTLFNQINIVPRWLIFILDLIISFISLTLAYLIKFSFDFSSLNHVEFSRNLLLLTILSTGVFFSIKTFAGIIRYTSIQDSFRILAAVIITNGSFFLINIVSVAFYRTALVSNSILVINCLACFLLMVTYRIAVKYFFLYIKNLKLDKKRIIIYGAGEAGVAAKRTFDHDQTVNKSIIAFVDDDQRKVGKTIDGISILDAKDLPELIEEHKLDEIIFASFFSLNIQLSLLTFRE